MKNSGPLIRDIGINLCLSCPFPDCIAIDGELCYLLKDEVKQVKAEAKVKQDRKDRVILENIQASIKNGGLTIPEICQIYDYEYDDVQRLMRIGKLKIERERDDKRIRLVVVGVIL